MEPMKPMKPMQGMAPMTPMEPMTPMQPIEPWWPADLGQPSSSGAQNDLRYAYFADRQRLVVDDGTITSYDTGDVRINGFGQQSGVRSPTFTSDEGEVSLSDLKQVD